MNKFFCIGSLIIGLVLVSGCTSENQDWEKNVLNETLHGSVKFSADCIFLKKYTAELSPLWEFDTYVKEVEGNDVLVCCGVKKNDEPLSYGNCAKASCVIYNT